MFPSRTEPDAPRDVRFHFCMKNRGTFLLGTHPAQLVKERQFSKHEDWRFIIKRSKNHDIGSKIRSIPLPNSNLFEVHGSIFKPHPSRNPGQTSVVRITHGVLFFCISKNTLYGLFCNSAQREHDKKLNNGLPILHIIPPYRDCGRYFCIQAGKGGTMRPGLMKHQAHFLYPKQEVLCTWQMIRT